MQSLTTKMPATIEEVIACEENRAGWIAVLGIENNIVRSVTRYKRGYFHTLRDEGRLEIGEDELVVGL